MARVERPQTRRPRRRDDATSVAGTELVVDVGAPAHGGHAVARADGRVIFVRHALPGERVRVRVTQGRPGDSFWRADAVEVLEASADRVEPPCPLAVPGGCGGCDLQHVAVTAQREWKATVVTDLLQRVGRLAPDDLPQVVVEALPGAGRGDNLRWRGRLRFAVAPDGSLGLRSHRGHRVVPIEDCLVATPEVMSTGVTRVRWPGATEVAVATGDDATVVAVQRDSAAATVPPVDWARPDGVGLIVTSAVPPGAPPDDPRPRPPHRAGRSWVSHTVAGVEGSFRVSGAGFWQAHPGAAATYVGAVRDALAPQRGQTVLDLYSGSGLFAAALADDVGNTGRVVSVEGDPSAVADARRNLHARPQVEIIEGDVVAALHALAPPATTQAAEETEDEQSPLDGAVLDPPRAGAGHAVVDALCALEPQRVAYVACDPAALARDVARFAGHGYRLSGLRAFDAFPMTHHVECVATLTRGPVPTAAAGDTPIGQDGRSDAAADRPAPDPTIDEGS